MLVLAASVVAVLSAALLGGRLSLLFQVRLRASWVPLVALLLQVVILQVVESGPRPLLVSIHILTYAMAAVFIWLNRRIPGLLLVAAGALSNGITIALNGGTLPARAGALAAAHIDKDPRLFLNSGVVAHPVLGFLGDVFAWPTPMPLANVFSVGDLLIVLGAGYGAHRICGSRLPRLRRTASQTQASEAQDSNEAGYWGMIEAAQPAQPARAERGGAA
jgi:hypothetical protein